MSRSSEELKIEHDKYYDAEIYRADTDWETWKLDFGGDAVFSVTFWDKDEGRWEHTCEEYKIWQTIELPSKELLIGWRPVEYEGMHNSIKYKLLSECEITYYPPKKEEEE